MKIIHAKVYAKDGTFCCRDVCTEGEKISETSTDGQVLDGTGCFLIPGLTDLHFHGCAGADFCDGTKESIRTMARYEASCGVTTILPASMTLPRESLFKIFQTAADYVKEMQRHPDEKAAAFCGIDMEGPFISRARKGAQNEAYIRQPDAEFFRELQEASGNLIKILVLAPEAEGADACIRALKDEVLLSAGHTDADYEQAKKAFDAGVHHVTHLYNAMSGLTSREPGVVGAAADNRPVEAELICDGVHVHPVTVRQTFRMFGEERIILISDSMEACGMPDGTYMLGGQQVRKEGNCATLTDGTIAGSVTNLMDCLRMAVLQMGIPLASAVRCAAVNPARSAGIYDRYGSISIGKTANLVLLREEDLSTVQVILKGQLI